MGRVAVPGVEDNALLMSACKAAVATRGWPGLQS